MAETRIGEILRDLDKALTELRRRSSKSLATKAVAKLPAPRRTAISERSASDVDEDEFEAAVEVEAVEEPDESAPAQGMRLEKYKTPEGYLIKKSRI